MTVSSVHNQQLVDRILSGVGVLLDVLPPTSLVACYLFGSRADGSIQVASDIDLLLVTQSGTDAESIARLEALLLACNAISAVPIDGLVVDELDMRAFGLALITDKAVLIRGTDIRPTLVYPPADFVAATMMHNAFTSITHLYPLGRPLPNPLVPHDPADPWVGFARDGTWPHDGEPVRSVKRLVTLVAKVAQALVALRTGRLIHGKGGHLVAAYRDHVGGEWVDYIETVFRRCRVEWGLTVPANDEDRRSLRRLCEQAYEFAGWFLSPYRTFLVSDLRHPEEARRRLARRHILCLPFPTDSDTTQTRDQAVPSQSCNGSCNCSVATELNAAR